MSVRPVVLVVLGALAPGCYDGFDPLDPEVLAGIARERGDAQGIAGSGIYRGELQTLECGCQKFDTAQELSLCSVVDLANQFNQDEYLPVTVVHADGTVKIRTLPENQMIGDDALSPTLYGPLDADGALTAAGVLRADGLVVHGQVFARLDGTLTDPGAGAVLEAEYQQRYRVDVTEGLDTLDVIGSDESRVKSVDCRERIGVELSWVEPLPDSTQPEPE